MTNDDDDEEKKKKFLTTKENVKIKGKKKIRTDDTANRIKPNNNE